MADVLALCALAALLAETAEEPGRRELIYAASDRAAAAMVAAKEALAETPD